MELWKFDNFQDLSTFRKLSNLKKTIVAKTKHYFTKVEEESFYHVYNRTVDRKPMFKNRGNYEYFLKQYDKYLSPVIDTYAYCLLGNHFHLLIRILDLKDLTTFEKLAN